nr:hypothetical protein [Tanacetum cinerariifolium]
MLNKENYVPWSSRLLHYAKSRPNGKLIHNSIINGPYVRRMIPEPGDTNREILVNETFYVQTDDELTEKELKHIEADDQAIQTILLDLPEDIYAAVDRCETAQEIWLRVQQMMKGSDIGIQEKKAKLFNESESFTSNEGESIESYYHQADESLAKHKALELEIKRLLKAVVSQDILSVVQKESVVDTSDLQTELERIDNTKTRRPQPRSNTKNDRVPSTSNSSRSKNKGAKVEEHHRNLLLSKNTKHMSSACNNIKLDSQNVISKVVCAMCNLCLISVNHDVCLHNYVNGKTSRGKKKQANVSIKEKQKKHQPQVMKPKKVGFIERKLLINFVWKFMGTVRFEND